MSVVEQSSMSVGGGQICMVPREPDRHLVECIYRILVPPELKQCYAADSPVPGRREGIPAHGLVQALQSFIGHAHIGKPQGMHRGDPGIVRVQEDASFIVDTCEIEL